MRRETADARRLVAVCAQHLAVQTGIQQFEIEDRDARRRGRLRLRNGAGAERGDSEGDDNGASKMQLEAKRRRP